MTRKSNRNFYRLVMLTMIGSIVLIISIFYSRILVPTASASCSNFERFERSTRELFDGKFMQQDNSKHVVKLCDYAKSTLCTFFVAFSIVL